MLDSVNVFDAIYQLVSFLILILFISMIVSVYRSSKRREQKLNQIEKKLDILLKQEERK